MSVRFFYGLTVPQDYAAPYNSAIYISPTFNRKDRERLLSAYPQRVPMESLRGWRRLTREFLCYEMSTDLQLRRSHQMKAYELYFEQARGNIRILADPADGFLRDVALPLMMLRKDQDSFTINGLHIDTYLQTMGWSKALPPPVVASTRAKVYDFSTRALAAV
jgi:hypothetical protein